MEMDVEQDVGSGGEGQEVQEVRTGGGGLGKARTEGLTCLICFCLPWRHFCAYDNLV